MTSSVGQSIAFALQESQVRVLCHPQQYLQIKNQLNGFANFSYNLRSQIF